MTERTCDDCVTLELCRPFVAEEKCLFLCPDCYEERISELPKHAYDGFRYGGSVTYGR